MFEIKVSAEFEAAHRIAGYKGKCDRLHGHSWTVEAAVTKLMFLQGQYSV